MPHDICVCRCVGKILAKKSSWGLRHWSTGKYEPKRGKWEKRVSEYLECTLKILVNWVIFSRGIKLKGIMRKIKAEQSVSHISSIS